MKVKDLTATQKRLWRVAQAYARSVAAWQRAYGDYERDGDPSLVRIYGPAAAAARQRLLDHIGNTIIVEPLE